MKSLSLLVVSIFVLVGCVSAHKDNMSVQKSQIKDKDLKVSVEKNSEMSTRNFVVLEFTIENTGDEYKRYESIDLQIPKQLNDKVRIVVGRDLINWSEGIKNKVNLERTNTKMFLAGVTAVAGASAALSNDPNYAQAAAGVAVAGAGTITINRFLEIRNDIRNSTKADTRGLIPDSHILATPISVPPNLFLKRFAVFHVKNGVNSAFYKTKLTFRGSEKTKTIKMVAQFDDPQNNDGEMPAVLDCKESAGTLTFRKYKINCVEQCNVLHPLNRKNCQSAYQRKFPQAR